MQRSLLITIGTLLSLAIAAPALADNCYCNYYGSDGMCSDQVCTTNGSNYNYNNSYNSSFKRYTNSSNNYYGSANDADVSISLTDSPDTVSVGGTITYRIRLRNRDNYDARTDVRAYLDSKTTYVSSSDDGDDVSSDEVNWDNVDIDANGTTTLTLRVRVRSNSTYNGSVRLRVETDNDDATINTQVSGYNNGYNNGNNSSNIICNYYNSYMNTYYSDYCDSRHAASQNSSYQY